ncbi:MAG: peptidylprolyl isomerase [Pseudomonadota bacterium]
MQIKLAACCILLVSQLAYAAEAAIAAPLVASGGSTQALAIDSVVAVVNEDVITRLELNDRLSTVSQQLRARGTSLPPKEVLERQLLEHMITDLLQVQYANENGLRVDDNQLDLALIRIAQQNNFPSLSAFRAKLESDGVDFRKFREEVRSEMVSTRLREREVESKLIISDAEVDNYLANKAKMLGANQEFHLAHILVVVPEQASADKIQAARAKAEQALQQIQSGADFAEVAAGFSDANDALKGGDLGWRAGDRVPPQFLEVLQGMQPGQNTEIMRSPSGFHILKLLGKRDSKAAQNAVQTHARHILIKTSEVISENEARNRLADIMERIEGGADFAEEARRYSQDGSAQQGGDLGWLPAGQTVPEFEEMMNSLAPGKMGAVLSQFGWHLIQVLERRNADVSEQQARQDARIAIGTLRADEQFQDWLRQLRDQAFVEYRLEKNN